MTSIARASSVDRIRVGVAGLGAVAQAVHLPLLARLDDTFEIAALADLSPALLTALGDRYRVPEAARFETVEALLDAPAIDGLLLLTSGSHGAVALAALDRGLPVLCEKPLAYTVAEADALAASPNAGRLLLGYMKVFDPAVIEAARIRADAASGLGALRSIEVTVLHPTSESQLAFAHLLSTPAHFVAGPSRLQEATDALIRQAIGPAAEALGRLYGGNLLSSMVHELSVIRAVAADAGEVVAIDRVDAWPEDAFPGSVSLAGRLADGTRFSIGWHYLEDYPAYREDVRFHHVGGSVELTFPSPYRLHAPTLLTVSTGRNETRRRVVLDSIEEAFEAELLAFRDLIRDGTPPRSGIADGRADIIACQRAVARAAAQRGIEIGGEAAMLGSGDAR
jgi:myo-inositol 2-dehydrogenase / D-chiro-inositol 1-dehydrogenase